MKYKITFAILFSHIIFSYCQQIDNGYAPIIYDWTQPLFSGAYGSPSGIGRVPDNSADWQHLFVIRHLNSENNYQLQLGSAFSSNDRLFFRKIGAGLTAHNPEWLELATRGTNNFTGDQIITGNLGINKIPSFYQHGGNNRGIEISNPSTTINSQSHLILSTGSIVPTTSVGSLTWTMPNITSPNKGLAYLGVISGDNSTSENPSSTMIFATRSINDSNWHPNMVLSDNGNLGIGILNPQAALDVFKSYDANNSRAIKIMYQGTWQTPQYASNYRFIDIQSSEEGNVLAVNAYGLGIGYNPPSYASPDKLYVNGNVGIGTSTPDSKLAVNGTVHSKEVKVDMTGWSDFVFKKEYELPTLEEVEKYIIEKGHLENIPTEKEVLENGIKLGEMNVKLLQKIEEMTLYMIEMKKDLNKQNEEIKKLKAK